MKPRDTAAELEAVGLHVAAERMRQLEREHKAMRDQIDIYSQQVAHLSHVAAIDVTAKADGGPIRGALFALGMVVAFGLGCALGWVAA